MSHLTLIVVQPFLIVQDLCSRPLRGFSATFPPGRRVVSAHNSIIWIFVLYKLSELFPEVKAKATIVVHVVFSSHHPDHVVCAESVDEITPPSFHLLLSYCLIHVFTCPPTVHPDCDPLAVRISDHVLNFSHMGCIDYSVGLVKNR